MGGVELLNPKLARASSLQLGLLTLEILCKLASKRYTFYVLTYMLCTMLILVTVYTSILDILFTTAD